MVDQLRYWLASGVRWRLRRQLRRFQELSRLCAARQEIVLERLLRLNADSAFSREHRLDAVHSPRDLQRTLPIAGYEQFLPFIDRLRAGDNSALLGSRNRLLMFALSSGTTAATKFIPITRRFYQDYRRGWQLWGIRAFDDHPGLHRGHILQIVSDWDRHRTASNMPCGNISGLAQQNQNILVRGMYAVPKAVLKINDPAVKMYLQARLSIADPHIRLAMTANPSTLVQLAETMVSQSESLLRDLHDGTLTVSGEIAPEIVDRLKPFLKARPERSRQLQRESSTQGLLPARVWPELEMLAVWTGGSVAAYLPRLREMYGDLPIRDHGLSASEGRMTIPLADNDSAGLLDFETHFFEFVPEAEIESATPITLLAHELEVGQRYFILLTTASGLYRYDIHDVVECTGYVGTAPLLKFLHKGAHLSNITGEKLSESQVVTAFLNVGGQHAITWGDFVLSPRWGNPPRYLCWIELEGVERVEVERTDENRASPHQRWASAIDAELMALNTEYAEKRNSGRLDLLAFRTVPEGTFRRWAQQRQTGPGGSVEQYKHPFLVPRLDFAQEMEAFVGAADHVFTSGTGM